MKILHKVFGAPLGADQGIPHSMQGCAVPMMRLGEPAPYGKIQKPCTGHRPHQRHRPIGFFPVGMLMTPIMVRKKKKKKRKNEAVTLLKQRTFQRGKW